MSSSDADRAIDCVVAANMRGVIGALARFEAQSALVYVALDPSQVETELGVYNFWAVTEADLVAEATRTREPSSLWAPSGWSAELSPQPSPDESPGYEEAEAAAVLELRRRGIIDPSLWVHNETARRLNVRRHELSSFELFVVFTQDETVGEWFEGNLEFAVPRILLTALDRAGRLEGTPLHGRYA